ncbi:hypothetical protein PK35_06255 [Tamlana nanhaiensis]|uniref:Tetratricopeptide repeat protein n=2 Tax=Neotamlana nanhaiensis TaxID=1382798 RepID=A0A0D7W2V4_9FLAO|nr:hypothetical protein PK35_06255 [Tamlana nanhaiensis]
MYRQALRTSNLEERISILDAIIKEEPNHYDAIFQRGIAKNDLGDFRGAIVDYSRIIIEKPEADTYFNRGNSKYSLQDLPGAKQDYAKAYMLDDDFIDALYSLACVKLDMGEFENAITDFTKILKEAPNFARVYILRGHAYSALENHKNAMADYNAAIYLEPSVDSYFSRATFFMDIKYYLEAKRDLSVVIRADRNNAYSYFYRGAANLFIGKFENALTDFTKVLEFDATDFDAYLGLAMCHFRLNNFDLAKSNFEKANNIISPNAPINSIEVYKNTYWHKNQYFYFNNNVNALMKLE